MMPLSTKSFAKMIGDKRRYRAYRARAAQLAAPYRTSVEAFERYLMFFGPGDGDNLTTMLEDLVDLFEQSAADHTPVRAVVGEDPVEFAETFLKNYPEGQWIHKERARLADAIRAAAGETGAAEGAGGEHR